MKMKKNGKSKVSLTFPKQFLNPPGYEKIRKKLPAPCRYLLCYKHNHSDRRLVTGLATAARMDWKLIVNSAIRNEIIPARAKTHQ